MKTWNLVRGVLFVLVGFCAGVALNVFPIGTTVQGAPEPPVTPPAALKSVTHNATLAGDGTTTEPLGIASSGVGTGQIANGAVTAPKLSAAAIPTTGQVLGFNGANLAWQNAPVGGVRVVDSRGQLVGPYVGGVLRKIGGLTFAISVMNNGFYQGGFSYTFYHTTPDCSGPRYLAVFAPSLIRGSITYGTTLFYAADPLQEITFMARENVSSREVPDPSRRGICLPIDPETLSAGLVATFDLSTLRLIPPFRLQF